MNKTKYRFTLIYLLAVFIFNPWSVTAFADDFHDARYNFLFGNHIDTHQKTRLEKKSGNPVRLSGFFFIKFTGEIDPGSKLPIAVHPSGSECEDEEDREEDGVDCVVGWLINAVPGEAKFLYHTGVNGDDHPVWMVNRVDIRQPGSFTHFHWITTTSSDPRAWTVPAACDKINASQLEDERPTAVDITCPGWFLQIKAVEKFAFRHGGEVIPVRPGIDNATHLNLATNYAKVSGITDTR
jgi:hypothetical protein